jgi:hypothetical protein
MGHPALVPFRPFRPRGKGEMGHPALVPFRPFRPRPNPCRFVGVFEIQNRVGPGWRIGGPRGSVQTKEGLGPSPCRRGCEVPGPKLALRETRERASGRPTAGRNGHTGIRPVLGVWAALGAPGDPSKQRRASPVILRTRGRTFRAPMLPCELDLRWENSKSGLWQSDGRTKWMHPKSYRFSGRPTAARNGYTGAPPDVGVWAALGSPGDPSKQRRASPLTLRTGVRTSGAQGCLASWIFAGGKLKIGSPAGRRPGGEHTPEVVPFWVFGRPGRPRETLPNKGGPRPSPCGRGGQLPGPKVALQAGTWLGDAQNRVGPGWRREHRETHGAVPRP